MSVVAVKAAKLGSVAVALAAFHAARPDNQTLILLAIILAWVALQIRDYKPNKRLRADNSELRSQYDEALRLLDESVKKQRELEASRDFEKSFAVVVLEFTEARTQAAAEHRAILDAISEQRKHQNEAWATFHQQIASLTSAIQVVASGILGDTHPKGDT